MLSSYYLLGDNAFFELPVRILAMKIILLLPFLMTWFCKKINKIAAVSLGLLTWSCFHTVVCRC